MSFFKKIFKKQEVPEASVPSAARTEPLVEEGVFDASAVAWNDDGQAAFFRDVISPQLDDSFFAFLDSALFAGNKQISRANAAILYAAVCATEPTRMMEVGGGYSTVVMRHAKVTKMLPGELITIDAQPSVDIIELVDAHLNSRVRDVMVYDFQTLQRGEMLVIDLRKLEADFAESDYVLREVLPKINSGVLVGCYGIEVEDTQLNGNALRVRNDVLKFLAEENRTEVLLSERVNRDANVLGKVQGEISSLWFRIR